MGQHITRVTNNCGSLLATLSYLVQGSVSHEACGSGREQCFSMGAVLHPRGHWEKAVISVLCAYKQICSDDSALKRLL